MTSGKDVSEKIFDRNRQQLSALMDGALSPDEAQFLLRRLQHDETLAQCLSRWQLCGDVLRGHAHAPAPAGFAQRVAAAISEHEAGAAVAARTTKGWRPARWGSGLALAASVAVIALFVARQAPELASPGKVSQATQLASQSQPGQAQPGLGAPDAGIADVAPVTPTRSAPRPARPGTPDTVADIAAAVAVAELPRRAAERRSRAQSQRAALRGTTHRAEPQVAVAVATPAPVAAQPTQKVLRAGESPTGQDTAIAVAADNPTTVNPFRPKADAIVTRPWPRALLPGATAGGGFNVDYGRQQVPAAFYPFQLNAGQASEPVRAHAAQADGTQTGTSGDDQP